MKTKTPTKPRKSTTMKTTATTKQQLPAVTREDGRMTINAEMVDDLFAQTIGNHMALQVIWERISLKEELS